MTLNIVIIITIFSIIGEHKVNGNEYEYLYTEINLLCFETISISIVDLNIAGKYDLPSDKILNISNEIMSMAEILRRINDWIKFLDDENSKIMVDCFDATECFYNDLLATADLIHQIIYEGKFLKYTTFNTPIVQKYIGSSRKYKLLINELYLTYNICNKTINTLATKTKILNCPKESIFGYISLLMTQNNINNFNVTIEEMFVFNIIKNALHDIFVGLANSLDDIKGLPDINIYLLKIINNIVIDDVIDLSQKLYAITYYRSRNNENSDIMVLTIMINPYKKLIEYFVYKWQKTLAPFSFYIPETKEIDEEFKTTSQLIKNNKVEPSIIGYYAAYMKSLEDTTILEYNNTDKDKILFLMEINAWTKILLQQSTELEKLVEGIPDNFQHYIFEHNKKGIHELFRKIQLP